MMPALLQVYSLFCYVLITSLSSYPLNQLAMKKKKILQKQNAEKPHFIFYQYIYTV